MRGRAVDGNATARCCIARAGFSAASAWLPQACCSSMSSASSLAGFSFAPFAALAQLHASTPTRWVLLPDTAAHTALPC